MKDKTITIAFRPVDTTLCDLKIGYVYLKIAYINVTRPTLDSFYFSLSHKTMLKVFQYCEQNHSICLSDSGENFYKISYQF